MAQVRFFNRTGQEIGGPTLIWADRLVIALWLLTGGLIGLVYAVWGDPGYFAAVEKIFGVGCALIWFTARTIDWFMTGRIR